VKKRNTKINKKICSLLVALILVLGLTACNKEGSSSFERKSDAEKIESVNNVEETPNPQNSPEPQGVNDPLNTPIKDQLSNDILMSISVFGPEEDDVAVTMYVNRSHEVVIQYENELLGEKVLMTEEYNTIDANLTPDLFEEVQLDFDNPSILRNINTICLYNKNNELFMIAGGRAGSDSVFDAAYEKITQILPMEWAAELAHEKTKTMKPITWKVDKLGEEYFVSYSAEGTMSQNQYELKQLSAKKNSITDTEEWLTENKFEDCRYGTQEGYYLKCGDYFLYRGTKEIGDSYPTVLEIYDNEFNVRYTIDFSEYAIPEVIVDDSWDVNEYIHYAYLSEDAKTLYVSVSHDTYAQMAPDNAHIIALDLEKQEIIWQTDACVSNAYNFVVLNDVIVAGYGFSDEDDFLYLIDKNTGAIKTIQSVKTGPDYIYERDGVIYVRTYDMDYEFEVVKIEDEE